MPIEVTRYDGGVFDRDPSDLIVHSSGRDVYVDKLEPSVRLLLDTNRYCFYAPVHGRANFAVRNIMLHQGQQASPRVRGAWSVSPDGGVPFDPRRWFSLHEFGLLDQGNVYSVLFYEVLELRSLGVDAVRIPLEDPEVSGLTRVPWLVSSLGRRLARKAGGMPSFGLTFGACPISACQERIYGSSCEARAALMYESFTLTTFRPLDSSAYSSPALQTFAGWEVSRWRLTKSGLLSATASGALPVTCFFSSV